MAEINVLAPLLKEKPVKRKKIKTGRKINWSSIIWTVEIGGIVAGLPLLIVCLAIYKSNSEFGIPSSLFIEHGWKVGIVLLIMSFLSVPILVKVENNGYDK